MSQKKQNKSLKRVLILASGLAFFSSTAFAIASMFTSSSHSQDTPQTATLSLEQQLQQQAEGYEIVLKREPNNPTALQGLILSQQRLDIFYARELQKEPNNGELLQKIADRQQAKQQTYQDLASSYQETLQKDPDNPFVLESLLTLRIQLRDAKGAIAPLEKLIELYPDRQQYQNTLNIVKQQIAAEAENKE
ncbi:MAG: hypothetical protein QNJ38_15830 [Prochloraceae cyanobacterium]|nr:hypothetical protein [Prochloraceae cyanobacterium]